MPKYEHLSVDIEALGTKPGSIVLSIGAVAFSVDQRGIEAKHLDIRISVVDSLIHGLTVDKSTLEWWQKQDPHARAALEAGDAFTLSAANAELFYYVEQYCAPKCKVWMKGPSFDGVLLAEAFERVGLAPLWMFWQERDVRTICDGVPEPKRAGVHHRAIDDAVHQAKWVREALLSKQVLEGSN